jgi:hypothetical protein
MLVAHGRKRSLNRNVVRSRPAAALAHQCGNSELTNKQKVAIAFAFLVMTITDETCIAKIYAGIGSMPKWKLLVLIDGAAACDIRRYPPRLAVSPTGAATDMAERVSE